MSNCPICRRSMLKFNLKKYGMCFTCYMKNKMSENNCGGTAKGSSREDAKVSDEINKLNQRLEIDESSSSQEFPPQNKLTKRVIAFPFDYDLPIKATEEFISIIENIREQAREEMKKEIKRKLLSLWGNQKKPVIYWKDVLKQLGEGEKK